MSKEIEVPDSEAVALAATSPGVAPTVSPDDPGLVSADAGEAEAALAAMEKGEAPPEVPEFPDFENAGHMTVPVTPEEPEPEPTPEATPEPEPEAATETEPEPEPEPEPVAEAEPEKEPEKPEVVPPWDKRRQKKDQELANLRKENKRLRADMARAENAPRPVDEIANDLNELANKPPVVTELDDPDEVNKKVAEYNTSIARLTAELATSKVAEVAEHADDEAYNAIISEVCGRKDIGEELRNDILDAMDSEFEREQYGPGNWPTAEHVRDMALRIGYEKALAKGKKAAPKAKAKPKVLAPDKEKGGEAPAGQPHKAPKHAQSLEEAAWDMLREGKLGK